MSVLYTFQILAKIGSSTYFAFEFVDFVTFVNFIGDEIGVWHIGLHFNIGSGADQARVV